MYHTHTPAEWAQMVSLGIGVWASGAALLYLTVDADLCDFDPRSVVSRVVESGAVDGLLIAVANAKHDAHTVAAHARHIPRDAAVTVAALLLLLSAPAATEAAR